MTTNHTPGPWDVEKYDIARYAVMSGDKLVAQLATNHSKIAADAALIAAAPELLTWLKWAVDRINEDAKNSWQYEQARAAIAKAKGEQA